MYRGIRRLSYETQRLFAEKNILFKKSLSWQTTLVYSWNWKRAIMQIIKSSSCIKWKQ